MVDKILKHTELDINSLLNKALIESKLDDCIIVCYNKTCHKLVYMNAYTHHILCFVCWFCCDCGKTQIQDSCRECKKCGDEVFRICKNCDINNVEYLCDECIV